MHKQLKIFLISFSFLVFAIGMFGPIYAIYVDDIGGDIIDVGTAWSIFSIISGLGIFIMGKFQDRIKKDRFMIILGNILTSVAFLLYYFVSNVTELFMVQFLLGVSTVIRIPAADSFYTKYLEKGKFASQWAAWEALYYTVSGIAALVGAFVVKIFSFRHLFLVMFVLSLINTFLSLLLKE